MIDETPKDESPQDQFEPNELDDSQDEPLTISAEMLAEPVTNQEKLPPFEKGMSYWPATTLTIMAIIAMGFAVQLSGLFWPPAHKLTEFAMLWRPGVMAGEVHRLVTPFLVHGSLDHVVGNLLALYVAGVACEHAFGWMRLLLLFFVTEACASAASVLAGTEAAVGASGALFGLMAAIVAFLIRHRGQYRLRDKRIGIVLLVWCLYNMVMGLMLPQIDNAAHLGGAITGAAIGWRMPGKTRTE